MTLVRSTIGATENPSSQARNVHRGQLTAAALLSAAVVLSSPYIGQLRELIRNASPSQFQWLVSTGVALAVGIVVAGAFVRIRDRRPWRFAVFGIGLATAALYARLVATGNAEVDVVEHVHFVEYGALAWLFYRAWRPRDDGAALIWPLLCGVFVGIADEFVQWFVPVRVGEVHDIFLNGVAVICGLCVATSLDPPAQLVVPLERATTRPIGYAVCVVLASFAFFFHSVHLGHQLYDPEIGVFWSRYTAADLLATSSDRANQWAMAPPTVLKRLSREDQYLSEGLWHVQQRNLAWAADDPFTAWRENRLLETFFAPVLDTPSYVSRTPPRWPAAQRTETEARMAGDPGFYISRAAPYPIYTWSPIAFWGVVLLAIVGVITAC